MATDYRKLTMDLKMGNRLASKATEGMNDGGSANLDSVFLRIPRASEEKVINAVKEAGLYCGAKRKWIGNGYFINPTCSGQGATRTKAVETMKKYLEDAGWDALIYYQAD